MPLIFEQNFFFKFKQWSNDTLTIHNFLLNTLDERKWHPHILNNAAEIKQWLSIFTLYLIEKGQMKPANEESLTTSKLLLVNKQVIQNLAVPKDAECHWNANLILWNLVFCTHQQPKNQQNPLKGVSNKFLSSCLTHFLSPINAMKR